MENKTIFITGAAGFIGSYLVQALLRQVPSATVVGIDSLTDYYDVSLKRERLAMLSAAGDSFVFVQGDIADKTFLTALFERYRPSVVVNLAAQAGVRYSITNPDAYMQANIIGFYNVVEACRAYPVEHLVFASSSSVYGANTKIPYSTDDKVDAPVSLYAATKKSNELIAHAYSKLYAIPSTGLRFFTVYGPMGRPDMAYFSFTDRLVQKRPIQIYNNGNMYRDFTYIDDIVKGIVNVLQKAPAETESGARYKIYNIGNNRPESLLDFVETLEQCLMQAGLLDGPGVKEFLPMQPGDVFQTYADVSDLERDFQFKPETPLKTGLERFVAWYKSYHTRNRQA